MTRFATLAPALAIAIAFAVTPAQAQPIQPRAGDVSCHGYNADSHSCTAILALKTAPDGGATGYQEMRIAAPDQSVFTVTMSAKIALDGNRLCLARDGANAKVTPPTHQFAEMGKAMGIAAITELAARDACIEMRPCGQATAAVMMMGGAVVPESSLLTRLFRAGDPAAGKLRLRTLQIADIQTMNTLAPAGCTG